MTNNFRYQLSGLQRVQAYQIDQLAIELTEIKEKLSRQQDTLQKLDQRIKDHEEALTQLIREQPLFWIEAREMTKSYIVELRAERAEQVRELDRLTEATKQLMADIVEARKAGKLLDKHRAMCLDVHVRNEERGQGKLVDEFVLWQAVQSKQKREAL